MDDVGKYQQRLQAIAEKRRQQEEEERVRKEMEEEWLKQAQRKRKSLRDQWLSEPAPAPAPATPAPAPASADGPGPQGQRPEEPTEEDQTESQRSAEEEEEGVEVEGGEEEQWIQMGDTESMNCTGTCTQNHSQAATEEDVIQQVIRATEGLNPMMMSQRMLRENGQDARSVLGMVAVQVERDPKTGATVIRSVAPVSAGAGVPGATVFDDGRKSVHAIGGAGVGPSAEELGQILSVINDVGMQVLLDEVTAVPHGTQKGREEVKREQEEEEEEEEDEASEEKEGAISDPTHNALLQKATVAENIAHLNSTESPDLGTRGEMEGCYESGGEDDEDEEEEDVTLVEREMDEAMEERGGEVDYRLDQGPVTLTFLGYTEAAGGQGLGHEDNGEVLKVERVIISDEGDEEDEEEESDSETQELPASAQELPASETRPQPPIGSEPAEMDGGGGERRGQTLAFPPSQGQGVGGVGGDGEVLGKGAPEVLFQDVPLDGNGAGALREEAGQGAEPPNQAPPSRAEGEVAPKHKTCQCCTVM